MSMRRARESSAAPAVVDTAVDVVRAVEAGTAEKAGEDEDLDANLAGSRRLKFEF